MENKDQKEWEITLKEYCTTLGKFYGGDYAKLSSLIRQVEQEAFQKGYRRGLTKDDRLL